VTCRGAGVSPSTAGEAPPPSRPCDVGKTTTQKKMAKTGRTRKVERKSAIKDTHAPGWCGPSEFAAQLRSRPSSRHLSGQYLRCKFMKAGKATGGEFRADRRKVAHEGMPFIVNDPWSWQDD
jgi:hypothetical protein